MTVNERLALTFKLSNEKFPLLLQGTPEEADCGFELLQRDKDERNRRILDCPRCAMLGEKRPERPTGHTIDADLAVYPVLTKEIEEWF